MKIEWASDFWAAHRGGVTASAAKKELDRIHRKHGHLKAQVIVDESKSGRRVLHPMFEWDNEVAGNAYRKYQARQIPLSIRVVSASGGRPRRPFIRINVKDGGSTYEPRDRVLSSDDLRRQALLTCLGYLKGLRDRYADIAELSSVFTEIDKAAKRLGQ